MDGTGPAALELADRGAHVFEGRIAAVVNVSGGGLLMQPIFQRTFVSADGVGFRVVVLVTVTWNLGYLR